MYNIDSPQFRADVRWMIYDSAPAVPAVQLIAIALIVFSIVAAFLAGAAYGRRSERRRTATLVMVDEALDDGAPLVPSGAESRI